MGKPNGGPEPFPNRSDEPKCRFLRVLGSLGLPVGRASRLKMDFRDSLSGKWPGSLWKMAGLGLQLRIFEHQRSAEE